LADSFLSLHCNLSTVQLLHSTEIFQPPVTFTFSHHTVTPRGARSTNVQNTISKKYYAPPTDNKSRFTSGNK